jgi:hypothetical protein
VFFALLVKPGAESVLGRDARWGEMADVTRLAELDELHHPSLRRGGGGAGFGWGRVIGSRRAVAPEPGRVSAG